MANGFAFQKAVKLDAKLRLALCGPAGSGKTFSALSIATELAGPNGRIAYVDTEHGSASKYADQFHFDVCEPSTYDPRQLVEMINGAAAAGYKVFVVDSLSHYWMGTGGELDLVDQAAKRIRDNSFAAWKTVTPFHNALVDALIAAPLHIIACLRTKTEWVIEKGENGKSAPRKIGLAPVMRDGIEFEFDVCGDLDQENNLTVTKSRCPELSGRVVNRPGKQMAETLKKWLTGVTPPPANTVNPKQPEPALAPQPAAAPVEDELATHLAMLRGKAVDKFVKYGLFGKRKAALKKLEGDHSGYYRILGEHDTEHSDKFKTMGAMVGCYQALWAYEQQLLKALSEQSDAAEPPADDRESWVELPTPEEVAAANV